MKLNYVTLKKLSAALILAVLSGGTSVKAQITQTFSYTGSLQTFTVPSCVSTITIETKGAQGGSITTSSGQGGLGASMSGVFNVTAGNVLNIVVGGMGKTDIFTSGGGGASGVGIGATPLIVAGGGGGVDQSQLGYAGIHGVVTAAGVVGGNTGAAGGSGGADGGNTIYSGLHTSFGGRGWNVNNAGSFGQNGQSATTSNTTQGTWGLGGGGGSVGTTVCNCGGGGGGYSGGGAGAINSAGGGGGSFNSGTNPINAAGVNTGNGLVVLKYTTNGSGVILSANSSSICTGNTSTLTASNVITYTWTPGGSNSTSITVSPTSNTNYTVEGTNSIGCISKVVLTVTVDLAVPVLTVVNTASASGGICPTKTVNLNASGATTYTWIGGSPTITNGVTFAPTTGGSYTVNGTNGCGTTSAVVSISVHPFPTVIPAASSSSLCSGTSLTLTATGNATNYVWSGHTSAISNGVGFSPVLTATYTVIGTSALSCTASATIPVTVVTTPVIPPIASPALVCIGGSSTLTAQGATNYTWTSATQTLFTSSMVVTPAGTGISTYTVTKANSNCVDTKIISVVTNSLPVIFAIVTPTLVCALNPATLAVGGGQTYTWTAPGTPTFSFNGPSPVVYPSSTSVYTVAASDGTCVSLASTVLLSVDPVPTIAAVPTASNICSGQSVTLNANGGVNYTWTATSGGTFYTSAITDTPNITTAYTLIGDNTFGCTSSITQVVVVNPNPTITIVPNRTLVCNGGGSTLTASGATNYTWTSNNALTNTTVVNPTSLSSGPVIYNVMGTFTTGCQSTRTVVINVYRPVFTVTGNTNTCIGGMLTLSAGGGNPGSYSWNTGNGIFNFQTLTTTLSAAAVFTLSATGTSITATCPGTKTLNVDVNANPTITAVAQRTTICIRESVDIYGTGGVSYAWNTSATTGTITVAPTIQTNYIVTGTDANGCVGTGTVQIKVSNCVGINELNSGNSALLIYPNPNNGEFTIQTTESMDLVLTNELGQAIRFISLSGSNNNKVYINDLSKGIYFISGQKDNLRINQKLIVAK